MERLLKKMTANPPVSILLGAAITAIVQSSSATTVMLVGLVNSGILRFSQAIYVCYGANIGTTVTAWIFSLMGVESDNLAVQFFQPVNLAPVIALIGAFLLLFSKKEQRRTVGAAFVGFAILIVGMTQMSSAVEPLSEMPRFLDLLSGLKNPAVGFLFSATFTAVIQSSSAATGILQALTVTGGIRLGMAIPMVMGINVGTCVTAVLSSIGASTGARRVAVSHLTMNLLCSVICLPLLMIGNALMDWSIMEQAVSPASIALLHTLFNIVLTLLLLPFTKQQLALVEWIVKEKPSAKQSAAERNLSPDERLLASPSVAVAECEQLTVQMSRLAHNTLRDTVGLLEHYDPSTADRILRHENQLDRMEEGKRMQASEVVLYRLNDKCDTVFSEA